MDLSIIIVSWNVMDLLRACLDSILDAPTKLMLEIIVVDSASSDASAAMIRAEYPQVRLLAQTENLGFVKCNNIGLKASNGRHVLLLNPDTEIIGDALATMVTYLDEHPDVGVVGPHTLNTDRTTQSTKRRFPTMATGFFESTWLQDYAPKSLMDWYFAADVDDQSIGDVDWVQGSALMARHSVYEQIGGLDEGFFMFSEELDWCKRTKDAGWRVVYVGTAQIIHHGGKSTDQIASRKHIYFHQSKLRYFRKNYGWVAAQSLRIFLLLNYVWQIFLEGTKGLLGQKRALRRERIRSYWEVLRSGLRIS
ncbi:MAG: glycosyltransferase family 2 protein [Chloroflexota bacterium]